VLGLIRKDLIGSCYHLSYGMVHLPSGRMKSREGTVVDADDLVDTLTALSLDQTTKRWPELAADDKKDELSDRSRKIALAALKFFILDYTPSATVIFDPEKSLDFNGKTGPSTLYSYARSRSIFRKCGIRDEEVHLDPASLFSLSTPEERALLNSLVEFQLAIPLAAKVLDPSKIVTATYNVARCFNHLIQLKQNGVVVHPVKHCADPVLKLARLQLTLATSRAIQFGLSLVGIQTIEEM